MSGLKTVWTASVVIRGCRFLDPLARTGDRGGPQVSAPGPSALPARAAPRHGGVRVHPKAPELP